MRKSELKKRAFAIVDLYAGGEWHTKRKLKINKPFGNWNTYNISNNQGATITKGKRFQFYVTGSNEWADWALNFKRFQTEIKKTRKTPKGEVGKIMDKYLSKKMKVKIIKYIPDGVRFHDGFFIGALKLWTYYMASIKDKKEIELLGHSYGSGVCTILAFLTHLFFIMGDVGCKVTHVQPESSPRVGNKLFVEFYNFFLGCKTYRIFRYGDIVCNVPVFGYSHIDTEYKIGKLKWWQIISKTFGRPCWHYPDLLPPLLK